MIKKILKALKPKHVHKYISDTYLWDFHRGGDGEIYLRSAKQCECGAEDVRATRLPAEITKLLDASKLSIWTMGSNRES